VNDLSLSFKLANGRTLESDSIRGLGISIALNVKQVIEIGRFVGLKSFVGKRDIHILNKKVIHHNLTLPSFPPLKTMVDLLVKKVKSY